MVCSPSSSSVHGIFQARILERVAISFSRDLPDPGIEPKSPALQVDSLPLNRWASPFNRTAVTHATAWRKVEDIILSKISQTQEDKYCIVALI